MPSNPKTRRRFLAAAGTLGTAALAGCSESSDQSTSGPTLLFSMERLDGSLADHYVRDLNETRPEWDEKAFAAAVNGKTYTTRDRRPFGPVENRPVYAERNGTYYRLDDVVVGEETVSHPVLRLHDVGRTDDLESVPDHATHSELPDIDAQAVRIAHMAARARGNQGGVPWGLAERGGYVYGRTEAADQSILLDSSGPTHVAYRDHIWKVAVSNETFHEAVYRADADPVATSEAELRDVLHGAVVGVQLDRNALSQAEREIIRTAHQDQYRATHPFPEACQSLLKKLHHRAYLDGNIKKDAGVDPNERHVLKLGPEYYEYWLRLETEKNG